MRRARLLAFSSSWVLLMLASPCLLRSDRKGEAVQLTEAEVTYVAVDLTGGDRRPVPIRGN
jgi:hypothetical protein